MCFGNEGGCWIFVWIGGEQVWLVGEDDECFGFDQVGYQGIEGVVVVEFDFICDYCIVFIDDWYYVQLQQGEQGGVGIEVVFVVGQVGVGQQYLCGVQVVFVEIGFVDLCQVYLVYGCVGLQVMDVGWVFVEVQVLYVFGYCVGVDQYYFFVECM